MSDTIENPMTHAQKDTWVRALRSDSYTQGRGALKTEDGYCCLGVANEVCGLGIHPASAYLRNRNFNRWEGTVCFIPLDAQRTLATLNDGGKTFNEIADYIEANINPSS